MKRFKNINALRLRSNDIIIFKQISILPELSKSLKILEIDFEDRAINQWGKSCFEYAKNFKNL